MAVQQGELGRAAGTVVRALDAAERPGANPAAGVRRALFVAILFFATVLFVIPFVWLVSASLKTREEVFSGEWIPDPIVWGNYLEVFSIAPVATWLFNSVLVGVLASVTVILSSAFVAFGFAYFRFPLRNAVFGLVLATMMLPGAVTMVPSFLIWKSLGWYDTLVPLWAGNLFGSAFYIFMLRQFFLGIPRELFEAARVDGANYLQTWWRIALPLTIPALIVVGVFEFKAKWTDLMGPLIYLQDRNLFTLPLGLKSLVDEFGQGGIQLWEIVMAASVIITLPMIVLFLLGQRYFVEGIATTGTKG